MIPKRYFERQTGDRLSGPMVWVGRSAWVVLAALILGLWSFTSFQFLQQPLPLAAEVTDPGVFTLEDVETLRSMGLPEVLAIVPVGVVLFLGIVYFVLGGWIFWHRSNELVPLLISVVLILVAVVVFSYTYEMVSRVYHQWLPLVNALTFLDVLLITLLICVFPDGRFVPRWTRFVPIVVGVVLLLYYLPVPEVIKVSSWGASMLGALATGAYARVHRYRHFSTPLQRQQTKWVGFGLLGLLMIMASFAFWMAFIPANQPGPRRVYALLTLMPVSMAAAALFPVSVAIAILRHRLWDIDTFINRTVVYGPLTGILMGMYVGSIRIFQTLFVQFTGEQSNFSILLSTLVLAGVFWPLRARLQAMADIYFKETPDPAKGLKAFVEQMREVTKLTDVGHITRRLLDETVAAFHAESGAVLLQEGDKLQLIQTAGAWSGNVRVNVPLEHAGNRLGELRLGSRHKQQDYTPQDLQMLREICHASAQALTLATPKS